MEYNIEVDKNDIPKGLRSRADFYTGKYIHRACQLILFNSKNEILLQQRASSKKWYPNLFTFSVSGTVTDESCEVCMQNEMQEEIGISIEVKELFKFPYFDTYNKAWHYVFEGKSDATITPDPIEIQQIKWLGILDLLKDIKARPNCYTPPFQISIKKYMEEFYMKAR